jgi:hypothetical protein
MDKSKYPVNWPAISIQVRTEAGMRCEWCKVGNYAVGARDCAGMWWSFDRIDNTADGVIARWFGRSPDIVRIVLTVAHLDHDPSNNRRSNLAALCQRCHLNHDRDQHMANAAATRERKRDVAIAATGQQRMW